MRVGLFGYGPSDSVQILRDGLLAAGVESARSLISTGESRFRGRMEDTVINYGSSNLDNVRRVVHNGSVMNDAHAVGQASNKLKTFNVLSEATSIRQLETTTSSEVALGWMGEGLGVYARTVLSGHSGSGIVYASASAPVDLGNVEFQNTLPVAPMYTKAVRGERFEYRVHVAFDDVILVQQKRKRDGWRDNPDYSDIVRNHASGWIYATSAITLSSETLGICRQSIRSLGLDFGAVDIIMKMGQTTFIEVNTAPGLQGESSRAAYVQAFATKLGVTPSVASTEPLISYTTPEADTPANPGVIVDTLVAGEAPWTGWDPVPEPVDANPTEVTLADIEGLNADIAQHQTMRARINEMEDQPDTTARAVEPITEASVTARLDAIFGGQGDVVSAPSRVSAGRERPRFSPGAGSQSEPRESQPNSLSSSEAPAPLVNTVALNGPGHYIADLSEGVRTVVCVLNSGEIYSAEHDLYLQAADISVVSQISL
jgi:hypothetical protein